MSNPATEFKPGNQLWKLRAFNRGPARAIEQPEELYELLVEYFEWCEANPLEETVVGWFQGDATEHTVNKLRAMTIKGFCAHSGIDYQQWFAWRNTREDLKSVIAWGENIMFEQKFSGAAAGLLKESIIARELGLADTHDLRSGDGSMTPKPTIIEFVAPEINGQPAEAAEPVKA